MTDTCGYTVIDIDGIEEPCDRPAPEWRWYQDTGHEDCLEPACLFHANEGGRRMHAALELADKWDEAVLGHAPAHYSHEEAMAWWHVWEDAAEQLRAAIKGEA